MRRFAVLFVVAVLAAAGAACGSDGSGSKSPFALVRDASAATIDEGSSKISINVETTGDQSFVFTGDGAFDYDSRRGTMTMDTGAVGAPGFPEKLEMRLDGNVVYMNLGGLLPGGKPWAKLDVSRASELGEQFNSLSQLGSNTDPRNTLAYLRGITRDVKKVGEEKVRGTDTTHLRGVVDLERAVAEAENEDAARSVQAVIDQTGVTEIPSEFWIDGEGRLRRYRTTLDLSTVNAPEAEPMTGTSTTTVELYDFGTDVEVAIPADDQVTDLVELLSGMGAAAGGS